MLDALKTLESKHQNTLAPPPAVLSAPPLVELKTSEKSIEPKPHEPRVIVTMPVATEPVATPAIARGVDVEDGQSCRDAREDGAPRPAVTTASASRAKVDAAAIDEGRVPSPTGTSHRKAKRAASGTSRVSASRVSTRGEGSGAAGTQRKPRLSGRASTSKKSSGMSRTARKR